MKQRLISATSLLLVFVLLSSLALSASAEGLYLDTTENITAPDPQNETYSIDGDTVVDQMPGDGYPVIFSIAATHVENLLPSSYGNKSFTKASLPSDAKRIICEIDLNHSLIDSVKHNLDETIVAGVCYYGYHHGHNSYEYIPVYSSYVPYELIGEKYQTAFLIAGNLTSGVTYYSYVKNRYPAGYVYGTLTLYYSSTTG